MIQPPSTFSVWPVMNEASGPDEERHGGGQLLLGAPALECLAVDDATLVGIVVGVLGPLRLGREGPRRHAVDPDPVLAQLGGQRPRQRRGRSLGDHVRRHVAPAPVLGDRPEIHDGAAAVVSHQPGCALGREEVGPLIDGDDPVVLLRGRVQERAGREDGGVVDQSADGTDPVVDPADGVVDRRLVAQVDGEGGSRPAVGLDQSPGLGQSVGVDVEQGRGIAVGRQPAGDRPAQPCCGAGDDGCAERGVAVGRGCRRGRHRPPR